MLDVYQNNKNEYILNSIREGVITTDLDGKITFCNEEAEKIGGWQREDIVNEYFIEIFKLVNYRTRVFLDSPFENVLKEKDTYRLNQNIGLLNIKNELVVISATFSPIKGDNQSIIGVIVLFVDNTNEKEMKEYLLEEKTYLKAAIENSNEGVAIVNNEGIIKQHNIFFSKMVGLDGKIVIGKKFDKELTCLNNESGTCEKNLKCIICTLKENIDYVITNNIEKRNIIYNINENIVEHSSNKYYEINIVPLSIEDLLQAMITIHEVRKEIDNNQYQLLVDNMDSAVITMEVVEEQNEIKELNILEVNKAFEKIFNTEISSILNKECFEVFDNNLEIYEKYKKIVSNIIKQNKQVVIDEYYMEFVDKWIGFTVFSPEKNRIIIIIKDITEEKDSQLELIDKINLSEKHNKIKNNFFWNMSDELLKLMNNSLNIIDSTVLTDLTDEQYENLSNTKKHVNSMLNITSNMYDFSKLEAGKIVIYEKNFDIMKVFKEVIEVHKLKIEEKRIKLNINISNKIPSVVKGDPYRVFQVLNNLVSNAIEFTDCGEISIGLELVEEYEESFVFKFIVKDTGKGISEKESKRLFDIYTQLDSSIEKKKQGTGLGLIISKDLIELMGGNIGFSSEESKGSSFYFTIKTKKSSSEEVGTEETNNVINEIDLKKLRGFEINELGEIEYIFDKEEIESFNIAQIKELDKLINYFVVMYNSGEDDKAIYEQLAYKIRELAYRIKAWSLVQYIFKIELLLRRKDEVDLKIYVDNLFLIFEEYKFKNA